MALLLGEVRAEIVDAVGVAVAGPGRIGDERERDEEAGEAGAEAAVWARAPVAGIANNAAATATWRMT